MTIDAPTNPIYLIRIMMLLVGMLVATGINAANASERGANEIELRVGSSSDPACDFDHLQDAIDEAIDGSEHTTTIQVAGDAALHSGRTYEIDTSGSDELAHSIDVIGGYADCSADDPQSNAMTTLSADGNGTVLSIFTGTETFPELSVTLKNLELTDGSAGSGSGGVFINGRPQSLEVTMQDVDIADNETSSTFLGGGGGIMVMPSEASHQETPILSLDSVSITGNSAVGSGGGIACGNHTGDDINPIFIYSDVTIADNHSDTHGGGIHSHHCRLEFRTGERLPGAPDPATTAPDIRGNTADEAGGGIHVEDGGQAMVEASLDGLDETPQLPLRIRENEAARGGGVALHGGPDTEMVLRDTRISSNKAFSTEDAVTGIGGAFSVGDEDQDAGPTLEMAQSDGIACALPAQGVSPCSRVDGNEAELTGAVIHMFGSIGSDAPTPAAHFHRTVMDGNVTDSNFATLAFQDGRSLLDLEGCPIHGNGVDGSLPSSLFSTANNDSDLRVSWSTIAGNVAQFDDIFSIPSSSSSLQLAGNIIREPGSGLVDETDETGDLRAICNIGHVEASDIEDQFDTLLSYSHIDPSLVAPAIGDLRLEHGSPAIDYCGPVGMVDGPITPRYNDILGQERGVEYDDPIVEPPDPGVGLNDLGVHEVVGQPPDEIFGDRFEEEPSP